MTMPPLEQRAGVGGGADLDDARSPSATLLAAGPGSAPSAGAPGPTGPLPRVELPPAGGAIRGIGEKFGVDAVTGSGSFVVPLGLTAGRDGFGPAIALNYDTGNGNGPFGLGWALDVPGITRKTEKGLPRYDDAHESDVFVLSGAEDLVPGGPPRRIGPFEVRPYRPRVETSFARIERWTRVGEPSDVHWRSLSPGNVLSIYGGDDASRIRDPDNPAHIFSWLISETRDDRGNAVWFDYVADDEPRVRAQRYLKHIRYGNRAPLLDPGGTRPRTVTRARMAAQHWLFHVVFDYGEHHPATPTPDDAGVPPVRVDAFSTYRAGFEVRTARLCHRVLMYHSFPDEPSVGPDCLVGATEFEYWPMADPAQADQPVYAKLRAITSAKFRRTNSGYVRRSLPPVEVDYSRPIVSHDVHEVDSEQLAALPRGLDPRNYQWVDLDGDGTYGVLTEQGGAWLFVGNVSGGRDDRTVEFAPPRVLGHPNASLARSATLMDVTGDGRVDLAVVGAPGGGIYEQAEHGGWESFRPFPAQLTRDLHDPNLRLVDLDGDGLADVLVTEGDTLVWHPGLGRDGFGAEHRVAVPFDERRGARVVFGDGTSTLYLADMSGDGLSDLVRVRNGEVAYWPNLGYGRFGSRVTMGSVPTFDTEGSFDPRRVRLADIDGTGTSDLIYLHPSGPHLYFNQSGNCLSAPHPLRGFPQLDEFVDVQLVDLLGTGTACLVWSSPLPGDRQRQLRYVDLMETKPHLLVRMANNFGAETEISYRSSVYFYLRDRAAGRDWITRSPYPVHVVETLTSIDRVSRHRFTTRYAYHHQYYDGIEREQRGFALVEQWDTEAFADLESAAGTWSNINAASYTPPTYTKTWFHTGIYVAGGRVTDLFSGRDGARVAGEYYHPPTAPTGVRARGGLPDTVLPANLTVDEEREACRALKGLVLRQEIYGLDGSPREAHPYSVAEQNFTVRLLQRRGDRRHAVFLTHPREKLTRHYERNPHDPRVEHAIVLAVNEFGQILDEMAVAYGRGRDDGTLPFDDDRRRQKTTYVTCSHAILTNEIDDDDAYRMPQPAEMSTYEIRGVVTDGLLGFAECGLLATDPDRRLIARSRVLYRPDDLGSSSGDALSVLPLGALESRAHPGVTLQLALTEQLLADEFRRDGSALLDDPGAVLREGGYVRMEDLGPGSSPPTDAPGQWWSPTGRSFLAPASAASPEAELAYAAGHFFRPVRHRDPFQDGESSPDSAVTYDAYDLLVLDTSDPVGNRTTVGERRDDGTRDDTAGGVDYRLLKPVLVTDANGNRAAVALDTLGFVGAVAVMGKRGEDVGDSLGGIDAAFLDEPLPPGSPHETAPALLRSASRRLCYDVFGYHRTRSTTADASWVRVIAREVHTADVAPGEHSPVQQTFTYFDGFAREVQRKTQTAPDPAGPEHARWLASGWTLHTNKGDEAAVFEPYFTAHHEFERDGAHGVATYRFYDAAGRPIAALFPDHSYVKTVFSAWHRQTWDRNDTVLDDPRADVDVAGTVAGYFRDQSETWRTWYAARMSGDLGDDARAAAIKSAAHARTAGTLHVDAFNRVFLTQRHNGFDTDGSPVLLETRAEHDIQGNVIAVRDPMTALTPCGRVVVRNVVDLIGRVVRRDSMDGGSRWKLAGVDGKQLRQWDSRGHCTRVRYDALRRPVEVVVAGTDPGDPTREITVERTVYGEDVPEAAENNLRTQIYLRLDESGLSVCHRFDFKGNPLASTRRLAREFREPVDWQFTGTTADDVLAEIEPRLEAARLDAWCTFDAQNRPLLLATPAETAAATVTKYGYDEGGLLTAIDAQIDGDQSSDGRPVWTPVVRRIDYDAKGRRTSVDRGDAAFTTYRYDELSLRLERMTSRSRTGESLQDLEYVYDAAGNIVTIRDHAHQPLFFRNRVVSADCDYTYDPTYRLIEARGREHIGQALPSQRRPWTDRDRGRSAHPADGQAVARYVERYRYDAVGNILEVAHHGQDPVAAGWTRSYDYEQGRSTTSGDLDAWAVGNRLAATAVGDDPPETTHYHYDEHGNTTSLPHLALLTWDFRDQIQATRRQVAEARAGPARSGETTYYTYDASGRRTRKVTAAEDGAVSTDHTYVGGVEFTHRNTGPHRGLIRTTVDISDGRNVVARIESRNDVDDGTSPRVVRHQLANHLKSTALEVDGDGRVLTYEEYSPYGSTTLQLVTGKSLAPKRDRFIGKERDDETGLYYVGARYYAAWLGRWISCDPAGIGDSTNLYVYAADDPVNTLDENGAWDISWRDVAIGAGVALLTVAAVAVVVATAGTAAAPLVAAAATAFEVSEATVVTAAVATGTVAGMAGTMNTANEVATGRTATGHVLTDQERSRRLGALPVEAVATVFGMRGSFGGGGGGAAGDLVLAGNGAGALRGGFSFSPSQAIANAQALAPALAATLVPVATAMTGSMGTGGGGSSSDDQPPAPEQQSAQQQPPPDENVCQQPPSDPNVTSSTPEPVSSEPDPARASFGSSTSKDYRGTHFAENPEAEGKVVVHHAVEQQSLKRYPGVVSESQMHSGENLRGIPKELNNTVHLSEIRKIWNEFYRTHPTATQEELLDQATKIDDQFGACFIPPVRPPVSSTPSGGGP
jgi:RHS repeat-associated protein